MAFYFLQNIIIILQGNCKESIQTLFRRKTDNLAQLIVQCRKHTLFTLNLGEGDMFNMHMKSSVILYLKPFQH